MKPFGDKVLIVRWLRKVRENRVFAANRRLVQNDGLIWRVFVVFIPMAPTDAPGLLLLFLAP